jgi:hypothetical protein
MRAVLVTAIALAGLCVFAAANAFATNPAGTGQPSQTCLSSTAPSEPGNAANAPGSAFNEPSATNPDGGTAGQVYAGNGQTTQTPANGHAVSQYDVACFQVSQHH